MENINKNNKIEDLEGEIWKDIPGFEKKYQVSNMGRIKSLKRATPAGNKTKISREIYQKIYDDYKSGMMLGDLYKKYNITKWDWKNIKKRVLNGKIYPTTKIPEKILCPVVNFYGYAMIRLTGENSCQPGFLIHRLVAQAFISNPENKPQVNHKNFNTLNNHIDNLEWVTASENTNHAIKNRKNSKKIKLNPEKVKKIRILYKEKNMTLHELARKFNVSSQTIYSTATKRSWKNV